MEIKKPMKTIFIVIFVVLGFTLLVWNKNFWLGFAWEEEEEKMQINLLIYDAIEIEGKNRMETAIDLFEKKYPQVEINLDLLFESGSQDFLKKLDLMQLTGVTGDIIQIPSYREYAMRAEQGYFYPIDKFIKEEGLDYDATYDYPSKYKEVSYGIPFAPGIYGVFINKTMLDAAGLPIPKEGWTWEDYREYAIKLTQGEGDKKVYGSFMQNWAEFKREGLFNVVMDNPYIKADGSSNLDSAYFPSWLSYIYDLEQSYQCQIPYSEVNSKNMNYVDVYLGQHAAMLPIGTWMIDNILEENEYDQKFQSVFAPFPVFEDGKPGVCQGLASYFCIGANVPEEKAKICYEFLRWFSNEGSIAVGMLPADKGWDIQETLLQTVKGKENLLDIDSVFKVWNSKNLVPNIITRDAVLFGRIDTIFNKEAQAYLLGAQDLTTTMNNIKRLGEEEIKKRDE